MMEKEVKPVEGTDAAGGGQPGEKQQQEGVPFSDHPRWKEVYGENKKYREFGTPDKVAERLRQADEMEAAIQEATRLAAEADAAAKQTPDEKAVTAQREAARKQLYEILPELQELETLRAAQHAHWGRLERAAVAETKTVLTEAGLDTSEPELRGMTDILADIIKNDATLWAEYEANPRGAVRQAFDKFAGRFKTAQSRDKAAQTQRDRAPMTKLPKAHGGGGDESEGSDKAVGPPKTLKEATERAMARLRGAQL